MLDVEKLMSTQKPDDNDKNLEIDSEHSVHVYSRLN